MLKCPHCGAPLDVSPDDVITICKYCGQIISFREDAKEAKIVKTPGVGALEAAVYKKLRAKGLAVTPLSRELIYIPVYAFDAHVEGFIVEEIRTKDETRIIERRIRKDFPVCIYGRYAQFEGLETVLRFIERKMAAGRFEVGDFSPNENVRVLGAQKSAEKASSEAKERAEYLASPIKATGLVGGLEAMVAGIKFYDANVSLAPQGLYFYPMFFYTWRLNGRRYTTIADGQSGTIIETKLPIPQWMRLGGAGMAIAAPLLYPFLAQALQAMVNPLLVAGGLAAVGFLGASFAMRGDRVWRR